ncbi:midasin-like [Phyllopteryx taeniolatus]|uniref:midasin-like n=1 Tax=Phyllopteryx taeniolatus TaxID=161469 RepID=UPI002AD2E452|nr:midasin-like [Phyllopteryx taeniolatus]
MLSKKGEQRTFSNGRLRDQWEKRAQTIAEQCKQEAALKEKSSLKLLFSKWNYHWALMADGDETKGEPSDFQRVTSEEAEKKKPRIKFKIVPPPPPKPKSKPPPTPSRRVSPQPLLTVKRKVEVDIFRLHWRESWMSLKPPKYLFLRANESKTRVQGFTAIDVVSNSKYKPAGNPSAPEDTTTDDWSQSWKQVKGTTLSECSEEKEFQWDILFDRALIPYPEIGVYHLPVWAGTWKIMNFAFRQQKQKWDCEWPAFQQSFKNKCDKVQRLLEQDEPPGWEDSWRLLKPAVIPEDCTLFELTVEIMKIDDVFLPGWNKSWLVSAPPLEKKEAPENIWSSCWHYRLQLRWCMSSLQSHQKHSNMMTRRRDFLNSLLTSELNDGNGDAAEWWDSWKTLKRWNPPGEVEDDDSELFSDTDEEDKGLHSDDEEDELEGEEIEEEENSGNDDDEEDEGVDEEEEAEDAEIEYNEKDINGKTDAHNGKNDRNETDVSEEDEDRENEEECKVDEEGQEVDEEGEELEEDIKRHEMKPPTSNGIQNHEDDEDGDNGMMTEYENEKANGQYKGNNLNEGEETGVHKLHRDKEFMEDEELIVWDMGNGVATNTEEEEEHGKEVEEKQVYRNITLQLKEIFQIIANEKKDEKDEVKDEEADRESTKEANDNGDTDKEEKIVTVVPEQPARETQSHRIKRLDVTDEEEEDEGEDVQEKEDEDEDEDEVEEEKEQVKEKEDEENGNDGDEAEGKDVRQDLEEVEEQDKMENVATDDDGDEEDKENDRDENVDKTEAEEDNNDEGASDATDKNNMKKQADGERRNDREEQTQKADEELQDTEDEEVEVDDEKENVSFDEDAENHHKREEGDVDDQEELGEDEEEDVDDNEESPLSKAPKNNEIIVNTDIEAAHKAEEDIEEEKKDPKSREPIKRNPNVPLHLQFHKLNTSFSSWKQSCVVAVAHRISDEEDEEDDMDGEQEELQAWRESWRICGRRKPHEDKVVCFSTKHQRAKHKGLSHEDDGLLKKEWSLSWKMTKKGEDIK